ncbi:MAG TPA: monovalent cation/H+ antiporter subunit D family protein [Thermodesulfobacteriota bacterium]|nr:monovalent cation/H+ antiporter subunit D family protein [Thermodesulfobacteriota bacterium]
MTTSPYPILIILVPLMTSFLIPLVGWWRRSLCYPLILAALTVSAFSSLIILQMVMEQGTIHYHLGNWDPPWGIEYVFDHLNAFVAVIVSLTSLLIGISSKSLVERSFSKKAAFFYCLFLLQATGLLGIVVTGDAFNLYVFLEIASLAGYTLIAIGDDGAPFASFNYMLYGTVGACFYLLGVGYLYIVTGSLNMADLAKLLPPLYQSKPVLIAFAFFIVGVAIKMALFPLHVWLPDAYTYAPSAVSALIAPLTTKVGVYVAIRIMYTIFTPSFVKEFSSATTLLSWVSIFAILFGCIWALAQTDLKRMFAYVLVAEIGYLALGIGLANRNGLTGTVLHIMNDTMMMASLFLVAGAVVTKTGFRRIDQWSGLHKKMPLTMAVFVVTALSVIGIPPMCGFFSKWYLLLGAINAKQWVAAAVLLGSSLVNAILFFRVIEVIYFRRPAEFPNQDRVQHEGFEEAPWSLLIPMLLFAAGIVSLGLLSGKIVSGIIQFAIPEGL